MHSDHSNMDNQGLDFLTSLTTFTMVLIEEINKKKKESIWANQVFILYFRLVHANLQFRNTKSKGIQEKKLISAFLEQYYLKRPV